MQIIRVLLIGTGNNGLSSITALIRGTVGLELVEDVVSSDVIILDLTGISLEYSLVFNKMLTDSVQGKVSPKVIAITEPSQIDQTYKLIESGIDFHIIRPFEPGVLLRRIRQIALGHSLRPTGLYSPNSALIQWTEEAIQRIGIPASLRGYPFLRDAVLMVATNSEYLTGVTKRLYPLIAEKYYTTSAVVERAMRHAIEYAWINGDLDYLYNLFGATVSSDKGKPTNTAFIARLSELLRLSS